VKHALLAVVCLLVAVPALAGETLSLLALGDTGKGRLWPKNLRAQYRVGEALAREDRRAPVDALVFLGDNFYPRGVEPATLRARVAENLVAPYCHFVTLTARGFAELGGVCSRPPEETHPVPLVAVLGNHDVGLGQGVRLQRSAIPEWVGNWLVPESARSYELGAGVSLVAFHSPALVEGSAAAELVAAVRAARGPWLILAAHHPIADPGAGWSHAYAERVRAALAEAGRPVHLFLAGHQHSLQALHADGAALHVVAGGGGADVYPLAPARSAERRFGLAAHGFARIDASPEALVVTLLALGGPFDRDAEPRARLRVRPDGALEMLAVR
jgi:hypothetical protein